MRVLVCGGRDYNNYDEVKRVLDELVVDKGITCIIEGEAKGADLLARKWAEETGHPIMAFPANWNYYKVVAGPIRNMWMLEIGQPDLVIAFPGGRGTANMVEQARKKGVKVIVYG